MANEVETNEISADNARIILSGMATDVGIGMGVLINALETLCSAICESSDDVELMGHFAPVQWIAERLADNIREIDSKIGELPITAGA